MIWPTMRAVGEAMSNPHTRTAVATVRHTVILLLFLFFIAVREIVQGTVARWPTTLTSSHERIMFYLKVIVLQLALSVYVWIGLRRSGNSMWNIVDASPLSWRRWLRYFVIGAAGWLVYSVVGAPLSKLFVPVPEDLRGLQAMLPHSPVERALWAAFAVCVGICEELIYRGYLLQQFRSWTRSSAAAVVLQALCYSLVHLALPPQMLVGVLLLGTLLGGIAVWQRSLLPGMILHVGVGLAALVQPA